jgi:hypothetical protein
VEVDATHELAATIDPLDVLDELVPGPAPTPPEAALVAPPDPFVPPRCCDVIEQPMSAQAIIHALPPRRGPLGFMETPYTG